MLSVAQAQEQVLARAQSLAPAVQPLGPAVLGQVLAEDVSSDLDMPPYDKALMDGYAARSADLAGGRAVLAVVDEVLAGQTARRAVCPGEAVRIMTGAPVPAGADVVVMVERTRDLGEGRIEVADKPPRPGQNIWPQAQEMRRSEVVLPTGAVLRPQEIGLLAAVGRRSVRLYPRPRLAVLSTGDELVEADQVPGPGQIRNSNGPALGALAARAGAVPDYLGIARDEPEALATLIGKGLEADVLALSGGVSAGKRDLVPEVLARLGVAGHFHKVEMKPGKPVFFGTRGSTLVFGLPGNPVSAIVCFELFVRPAVRRLAGRADPGPRTVLARLAEDFAHRSDRPTYHPARLVDGPDGREVRPVPWLGSPDLRGLTRANAFLILPPGERTYRAGEKHPVLAAED